MAYFYSALDNAAVKTLDYDTRSLVSGGPDAYEQFCSQADSRSRMTLEVFQQIAADLAGVKGRKNLIWLTSGVPYVTDPGVRPRCLPDYSIGLKRAYAFLAAAQVTVYPIDARGLMTEPEGFVTLAGVLIPTVSALGPAPRTQAFGDFNERTSAEHLSLESVAEATGGAAFYNTNDLAAAFGTAIGKGANYYTLSYIPPGNEYDGRHHSIKIIAGRPGLKLTYRDEYYAEDPRTMAPTPGLTLARIPDAKGPVDMRTEMERAMPTLQQILFDVQVEPSDEPAKPGDPAVFGVLDVKLKTKPLTRYGFQYAFPGRQIAFATAADGTRHGSLEFDLAAYDGDGDVVTSLRQAIDLNLTEEQATQLAHSPFRYFQQLDLPAGALFLRVGVLDRTANKVGTLEIPVTVVKTPAQHAAVGGR